MAGISSKAFGSVENKYKYNGIEHTTDLDLNQYDAFYRALDPQIGRFWQVDPETESLEGYSPYTSMENNPISNVDPLGDYRTRFGAWLHKTFSGGGAIVKNKFGEYYVTKTSYEGPVKGVTVSVSYGKGRDQYSNAREALTRDIEIQQDIQMNGKNSMYKMYDSPEEAGRAALSLGAGLVLPSPILKSGTAAVNASKTAAKGATSLWPAASDGKTVINGIEYTTHALERMQPVGTIMKGTEMFSRGVPVSVVENAIKYGTVTPGKTASEVVRTFENVRVITNPAGTRVITVMKLSH